MAFLKLRDQVGEERRGGIAPIGEEGREGGGPVVWAASAPTRRGGCEGGGVPPRGLARGSRAGHRGRPACQRSTGRVKPTCSWGARRRLRSPPREGRVLRWQPRRPRPAHCRVCASSLLPGEARA